MKVCLLNDSFPPIIDGVANVVMNYAKILEKQEPGSVIVGTPKYPDTDYTQYPYKVVPYQSFDTTKIVKGYRAGNPFDLSEIDTMADFQPDLIHSHCPVASTVMARVLRMKTDAPIVFTYHTKFDIDIAKAVKAKFIQKETIHSLVSNISACDEVWVVSQGAGENLKMLGYEGDYRVMSNGVDFAKGRVDAQTVQEVVKDYDLPEHVPVFLFVGRIVNYKGLPLILDAMKRLSEQQIDFRMVFIGSGPDEEELKQKAREYGLFETETPSHNGKCIFTGAIYDRNVLRAWNTRADLFLFPSTYDTNGIVVREAAACGLASVLIANSCAAEGITHGRNGYMISENSESMYALLKEICKDLDRVHDVGQHAMDEIYISWEDSVHKAKERYGEILDLKKQGKFERKPYFVQQFTDYSTKLFDETKNLAKLPKQVIINMSEDVEETMDKLKKEGIREWFEDEMDDLKENISNLF